MAVETLTCFPAFFFSGDTLRVSFSDGDYPSSAWTLKVLFTQPGEAAVSYSATAVTGGSFELVITAAQSAALDAGRYSVSLVYTETATSERTSIPFGTVQVLSDPTQTPEKSAARIVLEAMQAALLGLASGSHQSVSFNGQSFTKRNLKELQDAIDRQQLIVDREDGALDLVEGRRRARNIYTAFSRP